MLKRALSSPLMLSRARRALITPRQRQNIALQEHFRRFIRPITSRTFTSWPAFPGAIGPEARYVFYINPLLHPSFHGSVVAADNE